MPWLRKLNSDLGIFVLTFLLFLAPVTDADLGWHLRYGDYFWQYGTILHENTFSWSMPEFHWINHSWGYDLIASLVFRYAGFVGLSVLGAGVMSCSVFFAFKYITNSFIKLILWLAVTVISYPLLHSGFKSQHISLLATTLLWHMLHTQIYSRYVWSLPLLFLIWANIHGQFILGLCILGIFTLAKGIHLWWQWITDTIAKKELLSARRDLFQLSIITLVSALITLINPYKWNLHLDLLSYPNSEPLKQVVEWQPWPLAGLPAYLLIIYTVVLAIVARKNFITYIHDWIVVAVLGYLAFSARRIIPVYLLVGASVLAMTALQTFPSLPKLQKKYASQSKSTAMIAAVLMLIKTIGDSSIWNQSWQTYCDSEIQCSESVISFLSQNHIQGKIFNAYRLGGHLVYRYPQERVYIDGRMTLWQTPDYVPFKQYWQIIHGMPEGKELFTQLNPDYVLINHQYALADILRNYQRWPVIFEDQKVILFQNPKK